MLVSDMANISHKASHYSCFLNDNCDGTFTILGDARGPSGNRRPILVKSKTPLPEHAPPRMDPRPPVRWASVEQQQLFAASQRKARALLTPDHSEGTTVDEMMSVHSGCVPRFTEGASGFSELIESPRTTSPEDTEGSSEPEASSGENLSPRSKGKPEDENTGSLIGLEQRQHAMKSQQPRDVTQEKWQLLTDFLAISGIQKQNNEHEERGRRSGAPSPQPEPEPLRLAAEPKGQASFDTNPQVSALEIDSRFKRTVHPLPRDASLGLNAESSDIRLCSSTMGKVLVELEGNSPFLMGPHGMFTLMPTTSAQVSNASEADAVLVVYTVKR